MFADNSPTVHCRQVCCHTNSTANSIASANRPARVNHNAVASGSARPPPISYGTMTAAISNQTKRLGGNCCCCCWLYSSSAASRTDKADTDGDRSARPLLSSRISHDKERRGAPIGNACTRSICATTATKKTVQFSSSADARHNGECARHECHSLTTSLNPFFVRNCITFAHSPHSQDERAGDRATS